MPPFFSSTTVLVKGGPVYHSFVENYDPETPVISLYTRPCVGRAKPGGKATGDIFAGCHGVLSTALHESWINCVISPCTTMYRLVQLIMQYSSWPRLSLQLKRGEYMYKLYESSPHMSVFYSLCVCVCVIGGSGRASIPPSSFPRENLQP